MFHRHYCFQVAYLYIVFWWVLFLFWKFKADKLLHYYLSSMFWCCFLDCLACDLSVSMFPVIYECLSHSFHLDLEFGSIKVGVDDVLKLGLHVLLRNRHFCFKFTYVSPSTILSIVLIFSVLVWFFLHLAHIYWCLFLFLVFILFFCFIQLNLICCSFLELLVIYASLMLPVLVLWIFLWSFLMIKLV